MSQISVGGVAVRYAANTLLSDVTFTVERGEKWGVVGRNGSGKTTLFNLITGELEPTSGSVSREAGLRVALLDQHRDFGDAGSVWDAAAQPFAALFALEREIHEMGHRLAELGESVTPEFLQRYADLLERFERDGGYQAHARVDAVLQGLGFDPEAARRTAVGVLSGGERGRLGLVRQLVEPCDVLLLDEPTNHLDLETTSWLEGYLRSIPETVILITHDRDFLERVADHILHLEGGTGVPYTGTYSTFVKVRLERRLAAERAFQKQASAIAREEDYIRRNIAGFNATNARGRRRRLANIPRLTLPVGEAGVSAFTFTSSGRGGDQVLVAEDVRVVVDTDRVLLDGFTARVRRGDVIGFVGPNGAGKTTLLRSLLGERPAEQGTVRLGDGTVVAYYQQDLAQVPADRTLYDIIADLRPKWPRGAVQSHLGRFGFPGDSVLRVAGTLSGGERARVALAMMALAEANLLVFDEPTNHLDVESIEALEESLEEYEGTVILVSHDRALLRNLVTRVWALEGARIDDVDGSFDEWEALRASRERRARAAASARPAVEKKARAKDTAADERRAEQSARRTAGRKRVAAEARIEELDGAVRELESELAAPDLYDRADGAERAARLGRDLDALRAERDLAYREWEALSGEE